MTFALPLNLGRRALPWLAVLAVTLLAQPAGAHTASLTRVDAVLTTNSLTLTFQLNQADLLQFLVGRTNDQTVLMTEAEVRNQATRIADYVLPRVHFALDTNPPVRGVLTNWPPSPLVLTREEKPGETLPEAPAQLPVMAIPAFALKETAPVFANLPGAVIRDASPRNIEQYDISRGLVAYSIVLPPGPAARLEAANVRDLAWVYAGERLLGTMDTRHRRFSVELPARAIGPVARAGIACVIGIGLNVRLPPAVAQDIDRPVGDLAQAWAVPGVFPNRNQWLAAVLREDDALSGPELAFTDLLDRDLVGEEHRAAGEQEPAVEPDLAQRRQALEVAGLPRAHRDRAREEVAAHAAGAENADADPGRRELGAHRLRQPDHGVFRCAIGGEAARRLHSQHHALLRPVGEERALFTDSVDGDVDRPVQIVTDLFQHHAGYGSGRRAVR